MLQREVRGIHGMTMSIDSIGEGASWQDGSEPSGIVDYMERSDVVHPGEILRREFLEPLQISTEQLAKETDMAHARVYGIVVGKRCITEDTAARLSRYFGVGASFWLELQRAYDAAGIEEHDSSEAELLILEAETTH